MADSALSGLKKLKTWQKFAIALGGGAVIYYAYEKHKEAAAATAATTTTATDTVTDPTTGEVYSATAIDPLTGETYADEIDQYGSVSAAESAYDSGAGYYDSAGYYGGYYGSSGYDEIPYSDVSGVETGTNYTSNAAWAQAVTSGLTNLGYSSTDVSSALGMYFAGQPLNILADGESSYSIVTAAIAEYGPPPVGTYSVIGPSTTSTQPVMVSVPNVVGDTQADAMSALQAAGLTGTVGSGTQDPVTAQSPGAGSQVAKGTQVTLTLTTPPPAPVTVAVPDVTGDTQSEAMQILQSAGLSGIISSGSEDPVTGQSPSPGTQVSPGSTVSLQLTVYTPPQQTYTPPPQTYTPPPQTYTPPPQQTYTPPPVLANCVVPNIVGEDVVDASAHCQENYLLMSPEPAAVKGVTHIVTSQSPAPNTAVDPGTTVYITYN